MFGSVGGFYRAGKFGVTYTRVGSRRYKMTFMPSTITVGEVDSYSPRLLLLRCSGVSIKSARKRDVSIFRDDKMVRNENAKRIMQRDCDASLNRAFRTLCERFSQTSVNGIVNENRIRYCIKKKKRLESTKE